MRAVFALVLILGLGLAGFAAYSAQQYISQTQAELAQARANAQPNIETTEVFVAKRALSYGERLREEDVKAVEWPKRSTPENVFLDEADLFPDGEDALRTVLRAIEPGEPLMTVKLTRPGEDAGMTARLERGMRAFALRVNVTTGVSGFLRPGDRVDVYWTGRRGGEEITKLIDTNVELIAVDQQADTDRNRNAMIARNITVKATPQQVAQFAQAQSTGQLSLALVGVRDDSTAEVIEVDQRRLLGIEEAAPVEQEERCSVRTRRGGEVVDIPVPCTN